MKRTGNLKHDMEKRRAWERRSRANLRRSKPPGRAPSQAPERSTGSRQVAAGRATRPKKRRARIPAALRARVYARTGGLCVCGCRRRCTVVHHVLPVYESLVPYPHLELCEDNMVGMWWRCNLAHHNAQPRLRRDRLPACALELAAAEGPAAVAYIERTYPA